MPFCHYSVTYLSIIFWQLYLPNQFIMLASLQFPAGRPARTQRELAQGLLDCYLHSPNLPYSYSYSYSYSFGIGLLLLWLLVHPRCTAHRRRTHDWRRTQLCHDSGQPCASKITSITRLHSYCHCHCLFTVTVFSFFTQTLISLNPSAGM